ncbi:MAG TPA: hypothetical protein VFX85_11620 [Solirubrobacterales bacterium]|nr:hypothetical protein [Solirubrobacterales bacterium]
MGIAFSLATTQAEGTAPGDCFGKDCLTVKGGAPKDVIVDLPEGFFGNTLGLPSCSSAELTNLICPVDAQVGVVALRLIKIGVPGESANTPVFNLIPERGEVAKFGFRVDGAANAFVSAGLRADGEYVIRTASINVFDGWPLLGVDMTIWGVPADSSHDIERVCLSVPGCSANLPPKPFLVAPPECGVDKSTRLMVRSYQRPTDDDWTTVVSEPEQMHGCDKLEFRPSVSAKPSDRGPEAPSGLSLDLLFPQHFDDPKGLETPPLRDATITLPEGVAINPASADGLAACTDAQLGLGTASAVSCPLASKIGSIEATSPAIEETVQGNLYLRTQASQDPASGEMFRLAMVLENEERGILLKLPGRAFLDPNTGRVKTVFQDNPQLPVSEVKVNLKTGPRAPLRMPSTCGTKTTTALLTSWGGQTATITDSFEVSGCGDGFEPKLTAGVKNPLAGASSPFSLRLTRQDGEQNLAGLNLTLPEGLLAKLAGVPYCPEAATASASCPSASQVGSVTVGAGSGPNPLYVPQPGKSPTAAYLAGPYKGAPLSIVVKVPAQAGPFDLGTSVVRNALFVDPVTARVDVKSDSLPQIIAGIPVSYRDVRVDIDRSGFMRSPTSCDPMATAGTITSAQGKSAKVESRFQVANCERLAFKPKLALKLSGKTNRSAHPALKATLTMPQGGANIARAAVTLPKTEFLEQAHIRTICTRVQYAAKSCPKASIYGYAKAWSPLLDKPLEGPVYLRSSSNPLPDLVASLDGQIHIDLSGRIDTRNARIRNTFDLVPDAPVSKFVLTMQGGKKGLLVNNTELCKAKPRADVKFDGQNGKVANFRPLVTVGCGKKRK